MAERRITVSLFLCVFAAQSGAIALSPVLAAVAAEFDVSPAVVGQLRSVAGLAAGVASLALPAAARRFGLSRLLHAGAALLAVASLASAAIPRRLFAYSPPSCGSDCSSRTSLTIRTVGARPVLPGLPERAGPYSWPGSRSRSILRCSSSSE